MAQVKQWRAFAPGGTHDDYWTFNEKFREELETVSDGLPKPEPSTFAEVAAVAATLLPKLQTWRGALTFVDAKRSMLAKLKAPDASEKLAHRELEKIRNDITRIIKAHEELKALLSHPARTTPSAMEAKLIDIDFAFRWMTLRLAILDLRADTQAAYHAYPHETDSYSAQAEADNGFRAQAAKVKRAKAAPAKARPAPR
jgi:hypothetical protein